MSGESFVDYLDVSDDVFFIASGNVRVTMYSVAGKAVSFNDFGLGEVFGEYPAIDRGPRSASVEARSTCLIASLPAEHFRDFCVANRALLRLCCRGLYGRFARLRRAFTNSARWQLRTVFTPNACGWRH